MKSLTRALALSAALAFAGVAFAQDGAVEPPAAEQPAEQASTESASPGAPIGQGAGSSHLYAPPADKAQIVFFRKSGFLGAAISAHVKDGETPIGHIANGRFFSALVDPGKHTFTIKTEATDTLEMELEAGETYFVETTVSMGVIVYRLNLSPSDMSAFDAAYPKMKPAKPMKAD